MNNKFSLLSQIINETHNKMSRHLHRNLHNNNMWKATNTKAGRKSFKTSRKQNIKTKLELNEL